MSRHPDGWEELLTPPALLDSPEEALRAQMWTILCIAAGAISAVFAVARWVHGDTLMGMFDILGAVCFVGAAVYLQRSGALLNTVRFTSVVAILLLLRACVDGSKFTLPTIAWYGLVPLIASVGLSQGSNRINWTLVLIPIPVAVMAAVEAQWIPRAAVSDPISAFALVILFAGLGISTRLFEILTENMREQRDAALAALKDQKRRTADLIRVRNQFVRNVSHEIRTPLNHILGATQLLGDTKLDDEQKDLVTMAEESGMNLLGIIDSALAVHDLEQGRVLLNYEPLTLINILARLTRSYGPRSRAKRLRFHFETDPSFPPELYGDAKWLEVVLCHLLDNAIAFTSEGTIRLRSSYLGDGHVRFEVEDSGIGIDNANLERIFQPFRQVDESDSRSHGGLGTGLALCRYVARLMHGDVTCQSTLGRGSTFVFEARLDTGKKTTEPQRPSEDASGRSRVAWVLLAEPNPRSRQGVLGTLSRMGLKATGVVNQIELLDRAEAESYDVIFVDLELPGPYGLEEVVALLSRKQTCIVALTPSGQTSDVPPNSFGFHDHLPKPLRKEQVLEILRRWTPEARRSVA